jgi:hypothetical protein
VNPMFGQHITTFLAKLKSNAAASGMGSSFR